jgi:serine/threonine-protein phosphatase 5
MIIRSHEVKQEGYEVIHDGKLVTVFSAPNYCDTMGNKGAYITLDHNINPTYTSFTHVEHPPIKPMFYANSMYRMGM